MAAHFRFALLGAILALTTAEAAAQMPTDPLPAGARLRLGTTRMRDTSSWTGAGLSLDGKFLVGYTPKGFVRFHVGTGDPAGPVGPRAGAGFVGGRIDLSADGKRGLNVIYSGVNVWEADSGRPLAKIDRRLPYGDYGAALSADGGILAVGSSRDLLAKDKPVTAIVWDVEKNAKRAEVAVIQNESANVALSADGKILATWGVHVSPDRPKEGTDPSSFIQFWDTATGKELARSRTDDRGPTAVVFSPDGRLAAASQGTGPIRLIDPRTGVESRRLFGRGDQGIRLEFSPNGAILASAGADGTVQLWSISGDLRTRVIEPPFGPIPSGMRGLRFTSNDRAVAWAVVGFTALVWEVPSGKLLSPPGGHVGGVRSVAFTADGKEILTGGEDGLLLRWEAATGKELGEIRLRGTGAYGPLGRFSAGSIQITPDGKTALADRGGQGVFDIAANVQVAAPLNGLGFEVRSFLCTDARTLLFPPAVPLTTQPAPKSMRVPVWDVSAGKKLVDLETPVADLVAAATTPDRSKLITALSVRTAGDTKAEFLMASWDLATGKKLGESILAGGFGMVYMTPSPDNKSALVATPDGKLLALDVATMKVVREIDTEKLRLTTAPAFSPDGAHFVVAFGTGFGTTTTASIHVYNWASGKLVGGVRGHSSTAACLAFSPDGKTLATGSFDTTVLLWDVPFPQR